LPGISFITLAPSEHPSKSKIVNYCQPNDFNCHIY
jgi:hypothetical protein